MRDYPRKMVGSCQETKTERPEIEIPIKTKKKKNYNEDLILLNIVWAYFGGLITRDQMIEHLDRILHSFKELKNVYKS